MKRFLYNYAAFLTIMALIFYAAIGVPFLLSAASDLAVMFALLLTPAIALGGGWLVVFFIRKGLHHEKGTSTRILGPR